MQGSNAGYKKIQRHFAMLNSIAYNQMEVYNEQVSSKR